MSVYNLNVMCKVTLTSFGEDILNKYKITYDKSKRQFTAKLWSIMEIFGPYLYCGATDLPFMYNEIEIIN